MFKTIENYSHYQFYNNGEVFNTKTNKWLSNNTLSRKHVQNKYTLDNGKSISQYRHRIIWMAFNGVINNTNMFVHHKDGNPLNNNLSNLELISQEA